MYLLLSAATFGGFLLAVLQCLQGLYPFGIWNLWTPETALGTSPGIHKTAVPIRAHLKCFLWGPVTLG